MKFNFFGFGKKVQPIRNPKNDADFLEAKKKIDEYLLLKLKEAKEIFFFEDVMDIIIEYKVVSYENRNKIKKNFLKTLESILTEDEKILFAKYYQFEQFELISYIKGTKKASKESLMRLSPKGNKILEEIQIPAVNQDDLDVYAWLEGVYKKENKEIGNMKKTKVLISQFRVNSGIERNHLAYLCKVFISDEKEMEYSQKLEFLFWKPANVFQVKFDIEQSRLYQYYLKRKEQFDTKFLKIEN